MDTPEIVSTRWNNTRLFSPWQQYLATKVIEHGFPTSRGRALYIASDVSSSPSIDYEVFTFVVIDLDESPGWPTAIQAVRDRFLPDGRRMSYKKLSDRQRQDAFFPFLHAADVLRGICVSVAIRKTIRFLVGDKRFLSEHASMLGLHASWNRRSAERMLRISYLLAFFLAAYTRHGQHLIWISDEDEIFANERFSLDTGNMFTKMLHTYARHSFGDISIGTTAIDPGDRMEEDLVSIADIVAGGVGETLTAIRREQGKVIRGTPTILPDDVSARLDNFSQWFSDATPSRLRKINCVIDSLPGRGMRVGVWRLEEPRVSIPQLLLPSSTL